MSRKRQIAVLLVGCATLAACGSTARPSGTAVTSAAGGKTRDFEFSQCVRGHGVTNSPDPAFTPTRAPSILVANGMVFDFGSSVDPKAPAFQHATRDCGLGTR